jgi:hypothetical protein
MLAVDGIHLSLKCMPQIFEDRAAYRAGTIGCADHCHGTGSEHRVQAVLLWEGAFLFVSCQFGEIALSIHKNSSLFNLASALLVGRCY